MTEDIIRTETVHQDTIPEINTEEKEGLITKTITIITREINIMKRNPEITIKSNKK